MTEAIEKISDSVREIRELRSYVDDLLTIAKIPLSRIATESGASLQCLKAWVTAPAARAQLRRSWPGWPKSKKPVLTPAGLS